MFKNVEKYKLLRYIYLLAATLCLIFILRITYNLYHNHQTSKNFVDNGKNEPYQQILPMDEMDFSIYTKYFPYAETLVKNNYIDTIVLPFTLRYYEEADDKSGVMLEIPKGTRINTIINDSFEKGYGFIGYPTYHRGWRYARTFIVDENNKRIEELPYYYVRTKDLEDIADKVYYANKSFKINSQQMRLSKNQYVNKMIRVIDTILYDNGVYNSPDLYNDIIGITELILLVTNVIFLAICLITRKYTVNPNNK